MSIKKERAVEHYREALEQSERAKNALEAFNEFSKHFEPGSGKYVVIPFVPTNYLDSELCKIKAGLQAARNYWNHRLWDAEDELTDLGIDWKNIKPVEPVCHILDC